MILRTVSQFATAHKTVQTLPTLPVPWLQFRPGLPIRLYRQIDGNRARQSNCIEECLRVCTRHRVLLVEHRGEGVVPHFFCTRLGSVAPGPAVPVVARHTRKNVRRKTIWGGAVDSGLGSGAASAPGGELQHTRLTFILVTGTYSAGLSSSHCTY